MKENLKDVKKVQMTRLNVEDNFQNDKIRDEKRFTNDQIGNIKKPGVSKRRNVKD